jgi:hypothetical protein
MSVSQSDTLIGPIVTQLIVVADQITGIGRTYSQVPEAAPEDNSVMFPCKHIDVVEGSNGRLTLHLTFDIIHCFRRTRLQDALARAYAAMPAWLTVLGSYQNVRLGGLVTLVDLKSMDIKEVKHADQVMLGVISTVVVRYEFPIPV